MSNLANAAAPGGTIRMFDSNAPGQAVAPMLINSYSCLTVPAYWRAMNFLANNLSSFPRGIHKNGSPTDEPHPLTKLLSRRPNGYQNPTIFWRTLFFHAVHAGNGFAFIQRIGGDFGPAAALHNLLPEDVMPFRYADDAAGGELRQYYFQRSRKRIIPGEDVLHLQGLGHDGQAGADPVQLHASTMQRAGTIDRYQTRFLQRGTVIRGAVQIPTGISEEQVKLIQTTIRTYFQGADAERDVIVLSDGATLNNATLSPQESQLVQQAAYTTKQIAQVTGVPPAFLFDLSEGKYNATEEQAGLNVVRYTLRPWMDQAGDELTLKLLTDAEQDAGLAVRLDPAALLKGDSTTQTNTMAAQVNAGIRTPGEARPVLGLPATNDPAASQLRALGSTAPASPAAAGGVAASANREQGGEGGS